MANLQLVEFQFLAELARAEKITKLSLAGWTLTFNRRKRSLGVCKYASKVIELSAVHAEARTLEDITNTIRHELAHALCPFEGHSEVWRQVFLRLGGDGERYKRSDGVVPPTWVIVLEGKIVKSLFRKPTADYSSRYIPGRREETLGKLQAMPYAEYLKIRGE